ncbi:MAG: glycosyltransferase [Candidatus Cloacimonetes bacterium]|nr:glycosyltransferase [Candidatus Cloacimonadota bacterium]
MNPVIILFALLLVILALGILQAGRKYDHQTLTFSILIACRNEEKNLPKLFQSLQQLDYPSDKYEIILADDDSVDSTRDLIADFCRKADNRQFLPLRRNNQTKSGKKTALQAAAEKARGEILLFTDADCQVPSGWLQGYNKYFSPATGMVIGVIMISFRGFGKFRSLVTAAINAATAGLNFAFSASGGNLAIRKTVWKEIGGYESITHHVAGDDKLMVRMIRQSGWQINFNSGNPVLTSVPEPVDFPAQQQRKFGKFSMHPPVYKAAAVIVFLFYLYLPCYLAAYPHTLTLLPYLGGLLIFWGVTLYKFKVKFQILDIFFLLIYPYYMIIFSIWGLRRSWSWKP